MSAAKPAPDRRAVLGGSLALASAVAASAAPADAVTAHPDAALIALGGRLAAAERHREALSCIADEALDHVVEPPPLPGAIFHPSDWPSIIIHPERALEKHGEGDAAVLVWEFGPAADRLRADLAGWEAQQPSAPPYCGLDRRIARAREILAAVDERQAQIKASEDACGFTAARAAEADAWQAVKRLQHEIVSLTATTAEGLAVKAQVAIEHWHFTNPAYLVDHIMPRLVMRAASAVDKDWSEVALLSLVLDAVKLATSAHDVGAAA